MTRHLFLAFVWVGLLASVVRCGAAQTEPPVVALPPVADYEAVAWPEGPEGVEWIRDVVFGHGGAQPLSMDILRPDAPSTQPLPTIVFVHGGGWRLGDKAGGLRLMAALAARGYVCPTINYRLTPAGARFPAQIEDCKCAIRYLRAHAEEWGLDPDRIGVWGCSAGGHLAALLGTTGDVAEFEGEGGWPDHSSRVQAVCDWFGPADLPALAHQPSPKWDWSDDVNPAALLLGGAIADRPEAARRASPTTWATPDDPPFLIMHGTADALVSYKQSVLMAAALERVRVPVELVLIEDGEHGPWTEAFAAERRRRQVAEFFDTHLK